MTFEFSLNQQRSTSPKLSTVFNLIELKFKEMGIPFHTPQTSTMETYGNLPTHLQYEIYSSLNSILENINDFELELPKNDISQEIYFFRKFLFRSGLRLVDEDCLYKINPTDFIEVYNKNGLQIYRSWNFFRFCNYSLLELLTYGWHELYKRPSHTQTRLFELLPILFGSAPKTVKYDLDPYALTETKRAPPESFLMHMKFATPLINIKSNEVECFVSISNVKTLKTSNINFI